MADASPPADAPAAAVAADDEPPSPATAKSLARKRQSFGQPGDALSRDDAEQAEFADLVGKRVVCLEEHKPSPDYGFLELAIEPGDELELTGQSAPDGWLHAAMEMPSGLVKEGLVPEDFVELLDPLESEPASPEPGASQHGPIDSEAAAAAAAAGGPAGAPAGADLDDDELLRLVIETELKDTRTQRVRAERLRLRPRTPPRGFSVFTSSAATKGRCRSNSCPAALSPV